MSHIFDALQRSEKERTGAQSSTIATATATDLLRRAEHRALSQWESETISGDLPDAVPIETEFQGLMDEIHRIEGTDGARSTGNASMFPQFQAVVTSPSAKSRLVCLTDKDSPAAEAFRLLEVRLRNLRKNRALKKVLITSTTPGEGKSFAAANLACTLGSGSRERTLLIGGDLRRPTLSKLFGVAMNSGICEYLRGDCTLASSIQRLENTGLWLLPAGSAHGDPLEALQSTKLPPLFEQLAEWFDWIIIDSPPVLPLADTTVLARLADGILLVARRGVTEKRKLQKGLEAFESNRLIGALLNSSNSSKDQDYYYYRHVTADPLRVKVNTN
jgi:capsular exopolysaccharide synthesis family protein